MYYASKPWVRALPLPALLWLAAIPGFAQKYYSVQIGSSLHSIHASNAYMDCNGSSYSANDVTSTASTLTMIQGFPLLMQNGIWTSQSSSASGPTSAGLGQATYISALSAKGIVTTWEFGSYTIGSETAAVSSLETVDLNSGQYLWKRTMNHSFGGSCPASEIETQTHTAALPITTSSASAPSKAAMGSYNPFFPAVTTLTAPAAIPATSVLQYPPAGALAADGYSAVVLAVQTNSSNAVTFNLAAPGLQSSASFGTLAPYDPNFLASPSPAGSTSLTVSTPAFCSGTNAGCVFLALLWGPPSMPVSLSDLNAGTFHRLTLSVTALQSSAVIAQTAVVLLPPPLLLFHDLWSSPDQAFPSLTGFLPWLEAKYPHNFITRVDLTQQGADSFSDARMQGLLLFGVQNSLSGAANAGFAAREMDAVAHGMGGLAVRSFLGGQPNTANPYLLASPLHGVITIGTPHTGSALAALLSANPNASAASGGLAAVVCGASAISSCTLSSFLGFTGQPLGAGITSLASGLPAVTSSYNSIVGLSPLTSSTTAYWNAIFDSFFPGQTLATLLGSGQDDFSTINNQAAGGLQTATVSGIVHEAMANSDTGETFSSGVWAQVLYWLMGGIGQTYQGGSSSAQPTPLSSISLSGYAQVAANNVTFTPALNTTLAGNLTTVVTATSTTKSITRVLLFQKVVQPADVPLLYATQSPFGISFVPNRIGTVNFVAIVYFSDTTYAVVPLQYFVAPNGSALDLRLRGVPTAGMPVSSSATVSARGEFSTGDMDVTSLATYNTRSGNSNVFSTSAGGVITANRSGQDILDVSYGGFTRSAPISVGACSFALTPSSQLIASAGGSVTLQVTTGSTCYWTIDNAANSWLTASSISGTGSQTITLTAGQNGTGLTRTAFINLGGQDAAIIQAAAACSASVSSGQISAPASGASGTITVNNTCPSSVSANASWVTAVNLGSSVDYSIAANAGTQPRSAMLIIEGQTVGITQAPNCTFSLDQSSVGGSGAGFTGTVNVTATTGCSWTGISNSNWLTITSGSTGNSNGPVTYSVAANTLPSPRTGTLTIAGLPVTVTEAAACTYSLTPSSASLSGSGATGSISVASQSGCGWSAVSNNSWLSVTSGSSGVSNGTVNYSATANLSASGRTGTLTVAGQTFTATQSAGCSFSLSQNSASGSGAGFTGSVTLTTSSGCAWSASSDSGWLTITSGGSGTSSGTIGYSVAANTIATQRTGNLTIGGQTLAVTEAAACTYSLNPSSATLSGSGSTGSLSVVSQSGCGWTAASNNSWLSITSGSSGISNGTVNYSATANLSTSGRTGTLTVAGQTFTAAQSAGCSYSLSQTTASGLGVGFTGSVTLTTASGCGWTASSDSSWLTITSGGSGTGSGSVGYSVAANPLTTPRTGNLTIGGQTLAVTEAAACTYSLSPSGATLSGTGSTGSLNVISQSGCLWTAASNNSWLSITSGSSGTGSGSVGYSAVSNLSASGRTGTLTVAGQTFTATQSAGCSYSLSQTSASGNGEGFSGSVTLLTTTGCAWTASSGSAWLTITAGSSGSDSGTVFYAAAPNISTAPRSAAITIAGQVFTVNQAGISGALFVPVSPCRLVDTRNPNGPFGGPILAGGSSRTFDVVSGACGVPANAVAFSINVTVVPTAQLGYLTVWPAGQTRPLTSTLNSDGRIKANAVIVPAGSGGIAVFASNDTNLVIDINGYFVSAGSGSGLAFFPLTPCRISDTRLPASTLNGPFLPAATPRAFPLLSSTCGIPPSAQAYSLNITAIPHNSLGYVTLWPSGLAMPKISTLNALTGAVTANAAIVPAGSQGSVSVYASNDTDLVIDVNGYFADAAPGGLSLYSTSTCRALDSRIPSGSSPLNGTNRINIAGGPCAPPLSASAYVLNATVVPPASLGYLTLWPDGTIQPRVSTLNAIDGAITSNLALVPTTSGTIDALLSSPSHLILDLSGYFAP